MPPPTGRYARIAVERGIDTRSPEDWLVYAVDAPDRDPGAPDPRVGQIVRVPLGRGNRLVRGIILELGGPELLGSVPPGRAKSVTWVGKAALPPDLISLARWMAEYYVCPLGLVAAAMLPASVKAGTAQRTRARYAPAPVEPAPRLGPKARPAWEAISQWPSQRWPLTIQEIREQLAIDSDGQPTSPGAIASVIKAGLLRVVEEGRQEREPGPDAALLPTLTREQEAAERGVATGLGTFGVHLLLGVTGSGKTEVYLRLARRTLEHGRSVIILVPEISLTPQTAGRVESRLRDAGVAVMHSGLTAGQRRAEWERASQGEARVVVGARSGVFAPLENVGLIVVDEEHASDYKQDQAPRYHARDVAIKRAQSARCPVLLCSATPSLESWSNASSGRFRLWRLRERPAGARLPRVEIVDLRKAPMAPVPRTLVTKRLQGALGETLTRGGQAILLLNRRGFAGYVCCSRPSCGWILGCDHCDARMVHHRPRELPRGMLQCHHCLARRTVPTACPVCGAGLHLVGVGTQRLEDDLERLFPATCPTPLVSGQTLRRLDGDTMGGANAAAYAQVMRAFSTGDVRVLMGTQIIAKGLDFPNVRLVGVVNADTTLAIPDFRASERTFQLVAQVAGRAGRSTHESIVIVQTYVPEDPAIVLAASHDYEAFATRELESRRGAELPPITRMARVVARDESRQAASDRAEAIAHELTSSARPGVRVTGPMPCVLSRVAGRHRFAVEVTADRPTDLLATLSAARSRGLLVSDARTAIDVDPISLL